VVHGLSAGKPPVLNIKREYALQAAIYESIQKGLLSSAHSCTRGGLACALAETNGIINKSGAWFSYGDTRMGQGRENAKQFLRDNPDVFAEIITKVKVKLGMIPEPVAPAEEKKKNASSKKE